MLHQYPVGFVGVVGTDTAQAGLPHQDDVGAHPPKLRKVDTPPVQDVAPEVGHENIANFDQLLENFKAAGGADVDGDPFLGPLEFRLTAAPGPSGDEVHLVQDFIGLDLDDLCAHRCQDSSRHWKGNIGAQLQYPDS